MSKVPAFARFSALVLFFNDLLIGVTCLWFLLACRLNQLIDIKHEMRCFYHRHTSAVRNNVEFVPQVEDSKIAGLNVHAPI